MRYFLSGLSGGTTAGNFQRSGGSNINTGLISSARCYEPGQVLGMVLDQVDARGTSRRVFVDRLSASDRPLPHPGTQSATSGSTTRAVPRNLPGASSVTPIGRRFNGALPTVSVAQIRVDTTLLPDSSNRHLLKTYFTADAARSPVVLCRPAATKKPVPTRKVLELITQRDKAKILSKVSKTSFVTIPKATKTVKINAELLVKEAERQAELARRAQTIQEQQAALERMAALLAEAERVAAEAVALANEAAARAQSAEERAVAAEAQKTAQEVVVAVEETKDTASDVGVTSDGNGNVVIDTEATPPSEVAPEQPVVPQIGPSLPPKKSNAPLLLLAAAVGGYFWLKG